MTDWNADQYLKFMSQRTQPAVDLAMRIIDSKPGRIVDIGCAQEYFDILTGFSLRRRSKNRAGASEPGSALHFLQKKYIITAYASNTGMEQCV